MTRPCPWCLEAQPLVPSISGPTWAPSAKLHMWQCQFEDVPAAPAGTAAPVSAPSPALPVPPRRVFPAGAASSIFRRLLSVVRGLVALPRRGTHQAPEPNLQGEC